MLIMRERQLYGLVVVLVASCLGVGAKWSVTGNPLAKDAPGWQKVDAVLESAKQNATFPGCVAGIGGEDGLLHVASVGRFTYGEPAPLSPDNPLMTLDTLFDLASLTKVLATTTAAMILYQKGQLDLDMRVSHPSLIGPEFSTHGKETISIRNLLLHNAGFPPDPSPNYWNQTFDCPATAEYHPAQVFTCQRLAYEALLNQTLLNAVGSKYVYSDLSMITLMHVVGSIVRNLDYIKKNDLNIDCVHGDADSARAVPWYSQCYYEAFVRVYVIDHLQLTNTSFLPPKRLWSSCAPAWNDSQYRHEIMQGVVSDGNSYALGGIAGHAGLFSVVGDMFLLLHRLMFTTPTDHWINSTTVHTFTTVYNVSQSSRALGWDTNNYVANHNRLCGDLSSTTYTHTGYTGTQVCNDPERKLITVLLTNRVYKNDTPASGYAIAKTRREFNNAVKQVVDRDGVVGKVLSLGSSRH